MTAPVFWQDGSRAESWKFQIFASASFAGTSPRSSKAENSLQLCDNALLDEDADAKKTQLKQAPQFFSLSVSAAAKSLGAN